MPTGSVHIVSSHNAYRTLDWMQNAQLIFQQSKHFGYCEQRYYSRVIRSITSMHRYAIIYTWLSNDVYRLTYLQHRVYVVMLAQQEARRTEAVKFSLHLMYQKGSLDQLLCLWRLISHYHYYHAQEPEGHQSDVLLQSSQMSWRNKESKCIEESKLSKIKVFIHSDILVHK